MDPIQGRLRTLMATVDDPDTREWLEDTIALIEMNQLRPRIFPDARLSSMRVCRQHFLQLDPQVFMLVPIWQSVSFPVNSHQIVILQTAKFISLSLPYSLQTRNCGMESLHHICARIHQTGCCCFPSSLRRSAISGPKGSRSAMGSASISSCKRPVVNVPLPRKTFFKCAVYFGVS